nr:unnamed protein product [Digitaria exilis]
MADDDNVHVAVVAVGNHLQVQERHRQVACTAEHDLPHLPQDSPLPVLPSKARLPFSPAPLGAVEQPMPVSSPLAGFGREPSLTWTSTSRALTFAVSGRERQVAVTSGHLPFTTTPQNHLPGAARQPERPRESGVGSAAVDTHGLARLAPPAPVSCTGSDASANRSTHLHAPLQGTFGTTRHSPWGRGFGEGWLA